MINYFFHFFGPLTIAVVLYVYFFTLKTSLFISGSYAICWEVAQFEGWLNNGDSYNWNEFFNYCWLDTSLDLALSAIAITLVYFWNTRWNTNTTTSSV